MLEAAEVQLKILYVVPPSPHFAGIERIVHDVASGLAADYSDRLDVTVLYCNRYPELPDELPYRVIWEEVEQLRHFPRVARWLRREAYDIVIVAQFEPTLILWLFDRLRAGRTRFVMHLHGNPIVEGSNSRRARLAFAFFNAFLPRMQRVLAVSPSLARYVAGRVRKRHLIEYLPNPVRQFSDVDRPERGEAPVSFVSVGRLSRQKGYDVLVQAFAMLIAQGLDARLTIVGDGEDRAALEAQIAQLGIGDRVRLAGKIPDPGAELAAADCFVSASRWEGFGVAIVEAMSAGLYVIATDCNFGPSDLIDAPEKGVIVPAESAEALAAAMAGFVRSGRSDNNEQLRREAAARFSLENVVAQHAAMLESVCGRVL